MPLTRLLTAMNASIRTNDVELGGKQGRIAFPGGAGSGGVSTP